MPRADIAATVGGVRMTPPLGLTAWAAFTKAGTHTMVMGDIVLLEDQVNPVMSAALDNGLEVTALHNHFFWDTPEGDVHAHRRHGRRGDAGDAASARCSRRSRRPAAARARCCAPTSIPAKTTLDAGEDRGRARATRASSRTASTRSSSAARRRWAATTVGNAMGVNTWAAFAGSDDKAVVDGDFAMLESELQPVLKALRAGGHQRRRDPQPHDGRRRRASCSCTTGASARPRRSRRRCKRGAGQDQARRRPRRDARSDVDLEAQVDVARRLAAADAPVLAGLFAQHDLHVVLRDPERLQVGDDGAIEVPLRVH